MISRVFWVPLVLVVWIFQKNSFANSQSEDSRICRIEVQRILNLPKTASAHKVLELPDSANSEQAKKAYRSLAKVLHSDKIGNADPELVKLANEAFDRVTRAYRDFENLSSAFEDLLAGGYDRTKWSPLFPLKIEKSAGQSSGERSRAFNTHESLARIFVFRGAYPKTDGPEGRWLRYEFSSPGTSFRRTVIDVFAQKFLPADSPFFGEPRVELRDLIRPVFDKNAEYFDVLFWDYIKARKANTPFILWSSQSTSALEKVDRDDRLGLTAWFERVLDDVWISDWIRPLPIRAARVLLEADELQAVGARLAIFELSRAKDFDDFVYKGAHLPLELWEQAKSLGLEKVRNFNFPVVGASLDCMNYLNGWTPEMQMEAIDKIIDRIKPRKSKKNS